MIDAERASFPKKQQNKSLFWKLIREKTGVNIPMLKRWDKPESRAQTEERHKERRGKSRHWRSLLASRIFGLVLLKKG